MPLQRENGTQHKAARFVLRGYCIKPCCSYDELNNSDRKVFDNVDFLKYTQSYYMARWSRGKSERSDWFFLGRDFAIQTISMATVRVRASNHL